MYASKKSVWTLQYSTPVFHSSAPFSHSSPVNSHTPTTPYPQATVSRDTVHHALPTSHCVTWHCPPRPTHMSYYTVHHALPTSHCVMLHHHALPTSHCVMLHHHALPTSHCVTLHCPPRHTHMSYYTVHHALPTSHVLCHVTPPRPTHKPLCHVTPPRPTHKPLCHVTLSTTPYPQVLITTRVVSWDGPHRLFTCPTSMVTAVTSLYWG